MLSNLIDIWKSYSNLRYDFLKNNIIKLFIYKKCLDVSCKQFKELK